MTVTTDALLRYANETGLLMEAAGLPRIAGQVLGWLQVCEPEHQSLTDLTYALGISKASASISTRMLTQVGFVERIVLPNSRRDYYRISHDAWSRFFHSRVEAMRRLRLHAENGLRALEGSEPGRRARLERMRRLYAFVEREMAHLLERYAADEAGEPRPRPAGTGRRT